MLVNVNTYVIYVNNVMLHVNHVSVGVQDKLGLYLSENKLHLILNRFKFYYKDQSWEIITIKILL